MSREFAIDADIQPPTRIGARLHILRLQAKLFRICFHVGLEICEVGWWQRLVIAPRYRGVDRRISDNIFVSGRAARMRRSLYDECAPLRQLPFTAAQYLFLAPGRVEIPESGRETKARRRIDQTLV